MAAKGQAVTQVPQPTHIFIESSIGGSIGSSCSRSLWVQARAAAQIPWLPSQVMGSHFAKSIFAYLFTFGALLMSIEK